MKVLSQKNRQRGLTIIELMIALALSSLVLAGLFTIFLTTRQNQDASEHLGRIGEDARFFSTFVARDIRMAGYQNDKCSFSQPGLEWDSSARHLIVRYCQTRNLVSAVYLFGQDGQISYRRTGNQEPLLEGVFLQKISFGVMTAEGVKYAASSPEKFSTLRTIRIALELHGDSSFTATAPTLEIVVAVRNNIMNRSLKTNGSNFTHLTEASNWLPSTDLSS